MLPIQITGPFDDWNQRIIVYGMKESPDLGSSTTPQSITALGSRVSHLRATKLDPEPHMSIEPGFLVL